MRFACQSCGKAYNLPEEKIASKSNVKLKCRVCGAIVEVKRNGEVVATLLTSGASAAGGPPSARVSEAPPPMASGAPDSLGQPPSVSSLPEIPASAPSSPGQFAPPPSQASAPVEDEEDDDATAPVPPVAPVANPSRPSSPVALPSGDASSPGASAPFHSSPANLSPENVPSAVPVAPSGASGAKPQSSGKSTDTLLKMLAAFVTGAVVDHILGAWELW